MPRVAREKSETGLYHIMLRGEDGRPIFREERDYFRFLEVLKNVREVSKFKLFAWCLMNNHVHLLLKEGEEPLEVIFKRIGVSYVQYFNAKYDLRGHLFQDRFRSEPIEEDAYFEDVLRYICQNPVKAGLSNKPFEYKWLGCSKIKSKVVDLDDLFPLTDMGKAELLDFVSTDSEGNHIDVEDKKNITDVEAIRKIEKVFRDSNLEKIELFSQCKRDEIIIFALKVGISVRQLSRISGISPSTIQRVCKKKYY